MDLIKLGLFIIFAAGVPGCTIAGIWLHAIHAGHKGRFIWLVLSPVSIIAVVVFWCWSLPHTIEFLQAINFLK